jgi:nicotinamidase-related amidase
MTGIEKLQLPREKTVLVVVDVQERLVPAMEVQVVQRTIKNIGRLVEGCAVLGVPVLVTEQYPKGLGRTVRNLSAALAQGVVEKTTFSCCGEPAFLSALEEKGARRILLAGMEAHVCVYQTLLDLIHRGYPVHLVGDAVCSRHKKDYLAAMENARSAGATVTTTEMALFQMLYRSGTPEFKAVSALVKND